MSNWIQTVQEILAKYRNDPTFLVNIVSSHPIPLVKVEIFANVAQQLASFEMRQYYINIEDCPIECIYIFPVEVDSVFTHLDIEFTLQDGSKKQLSTKVEFKESAEVKYLEAISSGNTAVLGKFTETQRDMIRLAIGNFPPHSTAIVKCFYHQKLDIEDISYCLRVPMSYVPKYMGDIQGYINNGQEYKGQQQSQRNPFTDEVKQQRTKNIMEIAQLPTINSPPYLWNIQINIQMLGEIQRISSRNHTIITENVENTQFGSSAKVTLGESVRNYIPYKDFLLYIRDDNVNHLVAIKAKNKYNEYAVFLSILPDIRPPRIKDRFLHKQEKIPEGEIDQDPASRYEESEAETIKLDKEQNIVIEPKIYEYIFLIDRSGSMSGQRIKYAVRALHVFLHSLPIGCKFNVYSFGDNFTKEYNTSQIYDLQKLQEIIAKVQGYDANMGGTEIYSAVYDILKQPVDPKFPRHLYLLTDGEIGDTNKLVDLIKQNRGNITVHCFGIGDGVSTELVKCCASAGRGHYYFIQNLKEIEKKVVEPLKKDFLEYLIVKDINILDLSQNIIEKLVQEENLAHGDKFNMLRLLESTKDPKYLQITFFDPNTGAEDKHQNIPIRIMKSEALLTLAAHKAIIDSVGQKQAQLSVKYQILHYSTAMITQGKIMDEQPAKMEERKVPLMESRNEGRFIKIYVKEVGQNSLYTITAFSEDWVESLKNKIQEQEGIPMQNYNLLNGSRELEDLRTLSQQGIIDECTLHLNKKLSVGSQNRQQPQEFHQGRGDILSLGYCNTLFMNERLILPSIPIIDSSPFRNDIGLGGFTQKQSVQQKQLKKQPNIQEILQCYNNGSWNSSLYQHIKNQQLKSDQTDIKLQNLNESQLLTLVGINILMATFPNKQNDWKLIVDQGINYLKLSLTISDAEVQKYIQSVVYEMK